MRQNKEMQVIEKLILLKLLDKSLWEKSGHWDKFGDMFTSETPDEKTFAIKPMNCPGCVQDF